MKADLIHVDLIMYSVLSKDAQQKINELLGQVLEPLDFASLIRVLPKIGEKKKWNAGWGRSGTCLIDVLYNVSIIYMNAPREPEGMAAVENYLMKLL